MRKTYAAILAGIMFLFDCHNCTSGNIKPYYDAFIRGMKKGLPVAYEYNIGQADSR